MKICIDAGHNFSGFDTGAEKNGLREQDITFKIADGLKDYLHSVGISVIMTRYDIQDNVGYDLNSSLNKRCKIANDSSCDYFISIHCNSNDNTFVNGTEVLISDKGGKSEKMAQAIQSNIVDSLNTYDRGVKVDHEYLGYNLAVLEKTNMPAVLIETAFISNANEADLLNKNYIKFAKAIFLGICEFLGIHTQLKEHKGDDGLKFTDTTGHWAEKHIQKLADYGIVNGYDDKTFRPDNPVTRAEVAVMIANALSVVGK